jgi:hypothetical protein
MQDASKLKAMQARGKETHDLPAILYVVSPCLHAITSPISFVDKQFIPLQPTLMSI